MNTHLRLASATDAARIADIYAPHVLERSTSFELQAPDAQQMAERIDKVGRQWPWLVWCDERGLVQAYAYASAYAERVCYQWSTTVSVYVAPGLQRGGVARQLYDCLFEVLRRQGVVNAFAGITLPNDASLGLHRALGFQDVGVYRNAGFKLGAWHDVIWLGLGLQDPPLQPPAAPRPLPRLLADGALQDLLGRTTSGP